MTLETKILLTVGVPSFLQTVRASYLTGTSCFTLFHFTEKTF